MKIEVNKTYQTKFQVPEPFTVKEVKKSYVLGIYESSPHLGLCPLNADRLKTVEKQKETTLAKLRNSLTPFFTLAQILERKEAASAKVTQEMVDSSTKLCNEMIPKVVQLLDKLREETGQ